MPTLEIDRLKYQMNAVRDLYAEFFMLMLQSVEEDPDAPGAGGVDRAIEGLMLTIDDSMRGFLGEVRQARAGDWIPADFDGELIVFEQQLREGLTAMHGRVQARIEEMGRRRDDLKDQIQMIQKKRQGARGYRRGQVGGLGDGQIQTQF